MSSADQYPNDGRADARGARIRVSVHAPGGRHYEKEATVELQGQDSRITLKRDAGSFVYEATVEPGVYTLEVDAGELSAPSRSVEVTAAGTTASAYLGEPNWPAYRLGDSIVPFEPRDDLLAIAFEARKPDRAAIAGLAERLRANLPLEPLEFAKEDDLPFVAAEGAIWLFRLTDPDAREKVVAEVPRLLGRNVRIGIPVDLIPGQVKVLDPRFVVRFRDHLRPADIEALVREAGAAILRDFIQAGNARLIAFRRGDFRDHLGIIEDWFARDLLVYGEPDLLAEITDDAFPTDAPNDPTYPTQANLTLQEVDTAWQFLNGINVNHTLGSPTVYVATLDRGVEIGHTDIGGNLTDGTAQLAQCYDFSGLQACTVMGYAPDTNHGMGVYGIIAALTDNASAVAGIAPNAHQLGLKRPALTSVNYPDILLWAAGFDTGNPTMGWPAEPISPAAGIISCSHGVDGLALSGIMDDTFKYLATYGRGGRGTLMIYSAGNSGVSITGFRTWAAHPRTLAISNSNQPNGAGVEVLNNTSNFGPEIDICAQGNNAPSLNDTGGEQIFGGTSAAAPTVAAAAALMLTAEPSLTWIGLRDLLRGTAVQIDPANADPVGMWVGGFSQWYGFGRLDVDDAVQGADGFDPGSVNLVIRDNLADGGLLVPTSGTFWRSPDLWVRDSDPATDPIGDPAYGVDPPNEPAVFGADNWIRARVKNVGTAASSTAYLRVYLTHFAGSQFHYPVDYIPSINSGDPLPSPLVQGTYLIGETFIASLGSGAEQIFNILWPAAMVPPEIVAGSTWHPCLLAEISPNTGPAPSGDLVVDYSNLGQRNVSVIYSDDARVNEMIGVIGHEDDEASIKRIVVHRGNLPKRSDIWVRFPDRRVEAAVVKCLAAGARGGDGCRAEGVEIAFREGRRVFRLASGSRLILDVPMVGGRLLPVVLGASLPNNAPKGAYEAPLIEQDLTGRDLGAFALEVVVR